LHQGTSSAAVLDDGSTLVLYEAHGISPSPLTLNRIAKDGTNVGAIEVDGGSVTRDLIHESSIATDGLGGAWIAYRKLVPNGRNSGEFDQLYVHRYQRQAGVDSAKLIQANANGSIFGYQLAARANGDAMVVWIESFPNSPDSPYGQHAVFVATYSDATGWSSALQLSVLGTDASDVFDGPAGVALGLSENGHAVVMWHQWVEPGGERLLAVTRNADGTWGMPAKVFQSTDDQLRPQFDGYVVGVDNHGNALAVWQLHSWDGTIYRADFNRFDAASSQWLGQATISDSGRAPSVVVNSSGVGFVAWRDQGLIAAVRFDLTGWGPVEVLDGDRDGGSLGPHLVIDEQGRAAAIWNQSKQGYPYNTQVRGSRFDPVNGWSGSVTLSSPPEVGLFSSLSRENNGVAAITWGQGDVTGGRGSVWVMPFSMIH
jgi:hypothetical protein